IGHSHGRPAAGAFWCPAHRGAPRRWLSGKAGRRWRVDQCGFLCAFPQSGKLYRGRSDRLGTRTTRTAGRGTPLGRAFSQWVLAGDGYAARQASSRRFVGERQGTLENVVAPGMRVLITGNMGYVGPVLVSHLRARYRDAELI